LGEIPSFGYKFYSGDGPKPIPLPRKCGEDLWFRQGDPGDGTTSIGPWGMLACCYVALPADPLRLEQVSTNDPGFQLWSAAMARASYEGSSTNMLALAEILWGTPDTLTFHPNNPASLIPGYAILRYPNLTIVVVSGTTTPEQWAVQIVQGTQAPVNSGWYSTLPLWREAAVTVLTDLVGDDVPSGQPILVIGHSYGGVIATQVAATYKRADPTRVVKLVTFGMPRPGDQRLADVVNRLETTNLQNSGDPFPALPPQEFWWPIWFGFAGAIGLFNWSQYKIGGEKRELFTDGTTGPVYVSTALQDQMLAILASVIVIAPPPDFTAHQVQAYYNRLLLGAAAGTTWPVTPDKVTAIAAIYPP